MEASYLLQKSRSPLALITREDKELLDALAPEAATRIRSCAGFLINYLKHWHKWKEERYPTRWVYQTLRDIQKDLMDIPSMHVLRKAIALLEELELLSVRKNNRDENGRNGQDKSHQYWLHSDRIEALQKELLPQSKTQSKPKTPAVTSETPGFNSESPRFTVETHTQIPSTDACINKSLIKEREEIFVQKEMEIKEIWTAEEVLVVSGKESTTELLVEDKDLGENQLSAAPEPKCFEAVQTDSKPLPKLKADRPSGFGSDDERDGFYQALLELGRTQGKKSPAAWASAIIKSVNSGEPCQYLNEYREGHQIGSCEKQEWETAPGQAYLQFLVYLKVRNKKAEMTEEQAIVAAHQQLKDVNLARSLWESCKRSIAKYQDDWEKQKQLGVQNAYLPPELLPEREVSLEQVGNAIASLSKSATIADLTGCVPQLQIEESVDLEPTTAEEQSTDSEPEISLQDIQQKLDSRLQASIARMMIRRMGYRIEEGLVLPGGQEMPSVEYLSSLLGNPMTAHKVARLIAAHPEWGYWIDEAGEISDF